MIEPLETIPQANTFLRKHEETSRFLESLTKCPDPSSFGRCSCEASKEDVSALPFLCPRLQTLCYTPLVNSLRDRGPRVTNDPYSENFKVIKKGNQIAAVFNVAPGMTPKITSISGFGGSGKSTWPEAIAHGLKLGIPKRQLDFLTEPPV